MKNNYLRHFLLLVLFCSFRASSMFAQVNCGTSDATENLYKLHPELRQAEIDYNNQLTQQIKGMHLQRSVTAVEPTLIIPIVFHIIHTYGTENISDAQIFDQVAILNRDYSKLNADTANIVANAPFDTLAANTRIQFRLAQLDPNGNCTNGIDRIYSHRTNNADDASKLNQWPRDKYLNVWVVRTIGSAGVAGYAYYPSAVNGPLYPFDGVLILYNYIGSIGTSTPYTSRALTHEIGHWMSLEHPWGNNNNPEVACGDDLVDDTPVTMGHLSCDLYTPHCTVGPIADLYAFDSVVNTSGVSDPTPVPADTGMYFGSFSAHGVAANPDTNGRFSYENWDTGGLLANNDTTYSLMTGSLDPTHYYEVKIAPEWGYSMTLTGLSFTFQRNATGARSYAIRSSIDNFTANLAPSISPANPALKIRSGAFYSLYDTTASQTGSHITFNATTFKNLYDTVTFRIYAWNAEDGAGSFSVDNVNFTGTVGVIENTQNYMDYSYCSVMFTQGQKDRMRTALQNSVAGRSNLWTAANLAATGTDGSAPLCKPTPDFYSNKISLCAGQTVTFFKNILNTTAANAPTTSGLQWHCYGATPFAPTGSSVTVTYPNPGSYTVALVATNAQGTDSVVKTDYIRVYPSGAVYYGPTAEPFEVSTNYYYWWETQNPDYGTSTFSYANVGYSGTHSILMSGYHNMDNDVDNLLSPTYNLYLVTGTNLTFRCAAASRATSTADMTDILKVYTSTDCGQSWSLKKTIPAFAAAPGGSYFVNNGYHPEFYVPASTSEWQLITVPMSGVSGPNVRVKFEYTTGPASNNLYIDDVNINGTVGITENSIDAESISIYPNPTNSSSTVYYHLNKKANVRVQLVDMLGKNVMNLNNGTQAEGDYQFDISKDKLALREGIYFIRLTTEEGAITRKIVITE